MARPKIVVSNLGSHATVTVIVSLLFAGAAFSHPVNFRYELLAFAHRFWSDQAKWVSEKLLLSRRP